MDGWVRIVSGSENSWVEVVSDGCCKAKTGSVMLRSKASRKSKSESF